jgi:hypothetical protein
LLPALLRLFAPPGESKTPGFPWLAPVDDYLDRHRKPILIADIDHFWDPLCALLDHMEKLQFIRAGLNVNLLVAERIEDVLPKLQAAVRALSEPDKEMQAAAVERM